MLLATSQNRRKSRGRQSFCKTYDGDDYFVLCRRLPRALAAGGVARKYYDVGCRLCLREDRCLKARIAW
jgi:hypothetical protein